MRTILLIITMIISGLTFESISESGKVIIEVEAIQNSKGTIRLGVYNKKENLWEEAGVIKNVEGKINQNTCTLTVYNLPYGEYAFAMLHDENGNKKMDYNWLGIPEEGFGFSNNPKVSLSAPSFEETKFRLDAPQKVIKMKMKYM